MITFVTLVPTTTVEYENGVLATVKLYSIASAQTSSIYQAKCLYLEPYWTPTGHLIIYDVPPDAGCSYTAIYDPAQKKILAVLRGVAFDQSHWASDQNAFFVLRGGGYGPTCDNSLSVFDLSSENSCHQLSRLHQELKFMQS